MKYIDFDQAIGVIPIPGKPLPFFKEDHVGIYRVEFSAEEMKTLVNNGGKCYVVMTLPPLFPLPVLPVELMPGSPFTNDNPQMIIQHGRDKS